MFEDYDDEDFIFIKKELLEYDQTVIDLVEMLLKDRLFTKLEEIVGEEVAHIVITAILKISADNKNKKPNFSDYNENDLILDFKNIFKSEILMNSQPSLDMKAFQAKQYFSDQNSDKKTKSTVGFYQNGNRQIVSKKKKKARNKKKKSANTDNQKNTELSAKSDDKLSQRANTTDNQAVIKSINQKNKKKSVKKSQKATNNYKEPVLYKEKLLNKKNKLQKTIYTSPDYIFNTEFGGHEIIKIDYPHPGYIFCGNPIDGYYSLHRSNNNILIQEKYSHKDQLKDCAISGFSISKHEEEYFRAQVLSDSLESDSGETAVHSYSSEKLDIEMVDSSNIERKIEERIKEEGMYTEEAIFELVQNIETPIPTEIQSPVLEVFKFKNKLPIHKYVDEITEKIVKNRITIIAGDTGCGKTTQVPQILIKMFNKVIISLPKKVAAISIAKRVAQELDVKLGQEVGYKVRWDEKFSHETKILFVTDGILSIECLNGNISNYDLIVIDEFHERKMDYDFIISYFLINKLKKLLLMSATINLDKYIDLFGAATIKIPIRTYPNTICYLRDSNYNYEKEIVEIIAGICQKHDKGDILVFLPGMREINDIAVQMKHTIRYDYKLIKLASSYSTKCQMQIFEKTEKRKIILSTNIAESSITVNDLMFVIDSGQVRRNIIRWQADSLETMKISKSSADQRAGRVGRVGPGIVFRLYTKNDYSIFEQDHVPDTVCGDITPLVLKFLMANLDFTFCMKLLGYSKIKHYKDACIKLTELKCIDEDGKLTEIGKTILKMPLRLELAKTILKSIELNVLCEVAIICAFLEVDRVFYEDKKLRDQIKSAIVSKSEDIGDHISYLNIYLDGLREKFSTRFCSKNFIKQSAISDVKKISDQIIRRFAAHLLPVKPSQLKKGNNIKRIIHAFCDGFRLNVAKRTGDHYTRMRNGHLKVNIFGGSCLQYTKPDLILYSKLIHTNQFLMKDCIRINSSDLLRIDGAFYQK